VRFRHAIVIGSRVIVRGHIAERHRKLVHARATIHLDDTSGKLLAEAAATMFLAEPEEDV
jgi:acyl-CoA thioesterase FadM